MKHLLRILDKSGDTRIAFDSDDPVSFADAERALAEALRKGGSAFNVTPGTNDCTKRISKLSEVSQEAIVIPKIVSG